MRKLQDTIEVVQKERDRPLSETEAAIISRTNSNADDDDGNDLLGLLEHDDDGEILSAHDRLAAFFLQLQ